MSNYSKRRRDVTSDPVAQNVVRIMHEMNNSDHNNNNDSDKNNNFRQKRNLANLLDVYLFIIHLEGNF